MTSFSSKQHSLHKLSQPFIKDEWKSNALHDFKCKFFVSIVDSLYCIYLFLFFLQEGGVLGFYRGLTPTLIGMAPYAGDSWGYFAQLDTSLSFTCVTSVLCVSLTLCLPPVFILQVSHSSPSAPWRASAWSIFRSCWDGPPQTTLTSSFWKPKLTCSAEGSPAPSLRRYRKCCRQAAMKLQAQDSHKWWADRTWFWLICAGWLEFVIDYTDLLIDDVSHCVSSH